MNAGGRWERNPTEHLQSGHSSLHGQTFVPLHSLAHFVVDGDGRRGGRCQRSHGDRRGRGLTGGQGRIVIIVVERMDVTRVIVAFSRDVVPLVFLVFVQQILVVSHSNQSRLTE